MRGPDRHGQPPQGFSLGRMIHRQQDRPSLDRRRCRLAANVPGFEGALYLGEEFNSTLSD
jgi:hypothetical protein